jgi:nitroreductase
MRVVADRWQLHDDIHLPDLTEPFWAYDHCFTQVWQLIRGSPACSSHAVGHSRQAGRSGIGTCELPDLLDVRVPPSDAVEAQNEVMETWDALRARRNVRKFTALPVPEEALDRILEAGRRAPSASNWQPWDFVLVTDRMQLVELAKVWQGAGHVAGAAAAISIVAPVPQDDRQSALLQFDLGQATYAMTVAAADLGIGTGHAAAADQEQARAVLRLPEGRFLAYVLSVGYPADRPLAVIDRLNRRPFDEVVHRGRW